MVFHLGIICFLCSSCLSVSRVPHYCYLMTDFNAPHRTVLADFPHTALQSISLYGDGWYRLCTIRGRGNG